MGCDGGSIVGRQELVKTKKKEIKESSAYDQQAQRMTHCAISQTVLISPIVADHVGNLFNKCSLLEYLLANSKTHTTQTQFSHITSLRDVINVKLSYDESKKDAISGYAPYICPVTSLPANGRYRFVVMTGCGCVLSERAIKQVPSTKCLVCHSDLVSSPSLPNFFVIAPTPEEYDAMHLAFEQRKVAMKSQKKDKKTKKPTTENKQDSTTTTSTTTSIETSSTSTSTSTSTTAPRSSSPPPLEKETKESSTSPSDRGTKRKHDATSTSTTSKSTSSTPATAKSTSTTTKPSSSTSSSTSTSTSTKHVDKRPRVLDRDAWKIEEAARLKREQEERDAAFWRDKSDVYKSLFRKSEKYDKTRWDPISTKPISCMGML